MHYGGGTGLVIRTVLTPGTYTNIIATAVSNAIANDDTQLICHWCIDNDSYLVLQTIKSEYYTHITPKNTADYELRFASEE